MYFGILEFEYYDIFDQVSLGEKDHTLWQLSICAWPLKLFDKGKKTPVILVK